MKRKKVQLKEIELEREVRRLTLWLKRKKLSDVSGVFRNLLKERCETPFLYAPEESQLFFQKGKIFLKFPLTNIKGCDIVRLSRLDENRELVEDSGLRFLCIYKTTDKSVILCSDNLKQSQTLIYVKR